MYNLPLARSKGSGLPLHEHSAFLLVTGLLHDDLDDRRDTLQGVLEIDPILALWAVCMADVSDVTLKTFESAIRWLSTASIAAIGDPNELLGESPLSVAARGAWRRIAVNSITAGRIAQCAARKTSGVCSQDAFWLACLIKSKWQLDEYQKLNGHSPLHGTRIKWPAWVTDFESTLLSALPPADDSTEKCSVTSSSANNLNIGQAELIKVVSTAVAARDTSDQASAIISTEEQELWFRPYPEFRQLAPLLLQKLGRLRLLEEHFDETLQREKIAAMQQLAYGASHEINNPLANISSRAQTLVYDERDSERRKKLLAINDQAFRAYEMIADLMLFAKPPSLEQRQVLLDSLLESLRDELAETARQYEVQLELRLGPAPIHCLADPVQLAVAIKALCINGFEASAAGGTIVLASSCDSDGQLTITVDDTGMGLSEAARRHMFDPFYSGREAGRGLGFGLCKAWRIVNQHRGRISVCSEPSRGTRFTVTLPVDGEAQVTQSPSDRT